MKKYERELARKLRSEGVSINDILKQVPAAKSSVSTWVRDIELSEEQISRIALKQVAARERSIQTKRAKREARIAAYYREADTEYAILSRDVAFMFGLALYIGEGSKKKESVLEITNCDPRVIQKGILFFQKIGFTKDKLHCKIQLHPHLQEDEVLAYWREITGLGINQFGKVIRAVSSASREKTFNKQLYGTCTISVYSTKKYYMLMKWMELALT